MTNEISTQKKEKKYRTTNSMFAKPNWALQSALDNIDERLEAIESKFFKTQRITNTTRTQQMLLLKHLGILDHLKQLNISNKKLGKLLSVLLNSSESNIVADLSEINKPDSYLNTSINYRDVSKAFKDSGLKNLFEETDLILDNLLKSQK